MWGAPTRTAVAIGPKVLAYTSPSKRKVSASARAVAVVPSSKEKVDRDREIGHFGTCPRGRPRASPTRRDPGDRYHQCPGAHLLEPFWPAWHRSREYD